MDGHVGDALRFWLTGHTAVNKDFPQEFVPERLRNEWASGWGMFRGVPALLVYRPRDPGILRTEVRHLEDA